jgi:hypothetical protein
MAPEPISVVYFLNPSHKSVLRVNPPVVARQWLGKNVATAVNACNNRGTVGRIIFCAVHVISNRIPFHTEEVILTLCSYEKFRHVSMFFCIGYKIEFGRNVR